jgi:predicted O-methyltransferase YrrM
MMAREILSRKAIRVANKAVRHPGRAVMRLVLIARLRRMKRDEERGRLIGLLSRRFGINAHALLVDYRRSNFYAWFQERRAELNRYPGPYRLGTTGVFGCEALYLLVRATRPRIVVDTGVLYGASSAHILAALAHNRRGKLHSIDLGHDVGEPPHDYFVPPELQRHWELIIGDSRRELPPLLRRCGSIDLFHHDSLHTREHMTWEYETACRYLSDDGVLSSDDVQHPLSFSGIFRPNAFSAFCRQGRIPFATFYNLGVAFPGLGRVTVPRAQRQRASDPAHFAPRWATSHSWGKSPT